MMVREKKSRTCCRNRCRRIGTMGNGDGTHDRRELDNTRPLDGEAAKRPNSKGENKKRLGRDSR